MQLYRTSRSRDTLYKHLKWSSRAFESLRNCKFLFLSTHVVRTMKSCRSWVSWSSSLKETAFQVDRGFIFISLNWNFLRRVYLNISWEGLRHVINLLLDLSFMSLLLSESFSEVFLLALQLPERTDFNSQRHLFCYLVELINFAWTYT